MLGTVKELLVRVLVSRHQLQGTGHVGEAAASSRGAAATRRRAVALARRHVGLLPGLRQRVGLLARSGALDPVARGSLDEVRVLLAGAARTRLEDVRLIFPFCGESRYR